MITADPGSAADTPGPQSSPVEVAEELTRFLSEVGDTLEGDRLTKDELNRRRERIERAAVRRLAAGATVTASAAISAEDLRRDNNALQQALAELRHERRRANSRRLYAMAAAIVVFAMLGLGALVARGTGVVPQPGGDTTSSRNSSQLDPLPGGNGLGGPEVTGQRYSGTDPRSGVHLDVALEKKVWGTQVSFAVFGIRGPQVYRLLAVHTDGTTEALLSWNVGKESWGTAANPQPLMLQAVTATSREDIAHLQVQEVTASGAGGTMVSVP